MKIPNHRRHAYTLVELMIAVAIIALLAAIAIPAGLRAHRRSQAGVVLNDLRMIDAAVELFAAENNRREGAPVAVAEWQTYIKENLQLAQTGKDILGHPFGPQVVGQLPHVPTDTLIALADVANAGFWAPFEGLVGATALPIGNPTTQQSQLGKLEQ
ncbi:MAG TPA: prepilin-type N-terminal cleavage/methylation domain-containing protein [Chthoniobacterales bacterium]